MRRGNPGLEPVSWLERSKTITFSSRSLAALNYIPLVFVTVITGCYDQQDDNGGAQYNRVPVDPGTEGSFQDASGAWFELVGSVVNIKSMGAKGDGVTVDTQAFRDAINKASGAPVYAPRGEYLIDAASTFVIDPSTGAAKFGPGVKIYGDGADVTVFKYTGDDGFMVDVDSAGHVPPDDSYVIGCQFTNFSIRGDDSLTDNGGIKLRTCYHTTISACRFTELASDGVKLASALIDYDATGYTKIYNCSIDLCGGWGINAKADLATNSTSFVEVDHCRIQSCGTTDGAYQPTSGGMQWKGLICQISNCGFTLNKNAALWIPGEANLANRITVYNTDFENSLNRAIFSRGVIGFHAENLEFLANVAGPTSVFVEFEANDFVVEDVQFNGCTVRCGLDGGGNAIPNTAFKLSGVNAVTETCRVNNVYWLDYDYGPTQIRFDGWTFDPVAITGALVVSSATELLYRAVEYGNGNTFPLRLAGPRSQSPGGVASKTGELVTGRFGSGISIPNTGLANSALCYVYSKDNGGNSLTMVVNNTAPVLNNDFGLYTMTGEPAYILAGRWMTDGSGQFITTGTGWLNAQRVTVTSGIGYMWRDGTGTMRVNNSLPNSDTDGNAI